jgi:hypothetical protein
VPEVRTIRQFLAMTPAQRDAWRAAFHALNMMRDGLSLAAAARRAGTTPAIVRSYVGPALVRKGRRWVARPADRLLRPMQILAEGGIEYEVVVRGSRAASLIGGHWSAIGYYLDTGDASRLAHFRGKRVAGRTLETDPDVIDIWDRRGELQVEDIYSLTP